MADPFWPRFWEFIHNQANESDIIEIACRAWHDAGLSPGQPRWDKLVSLEDGRIRGWRLQMQAALEAIGVIGDAEAM